MGGDGVCGTDDDVVVATTVTDEEGNYRFPDVPPGDYEVRQPGLEGYVGSSGSVPVTMTSGGAVGAPLGQQAIGTIAGVVYDDLNRDGKRGAGERGIGGVTLTLYPLGQGTALATAVTDSDGSYLFVGVEDGSYRVVETDLPGYASTTGNEVIVALAGDAGRACFGDLSAMPSEADYTILLPTLRQGTIG